MAASITSPYYTMNLVLRLPPDVGLTLHRCSRQRHVMHFGCWPVATAAKQFWMLPAHSAHSKRGEVAGKPCCAGLRGPGLGKGQQLALLHRYAFALQPFNKMRIQDLHRVVLSVTKEDLPEWILTQILVAMDSVRWRCAPRHTSLPVTRALRSHSYVRARTADCHVAATSNVVSLGM